MEAVRSSRGWRAGLSGLALLLAGLLLWAGPGQGQSPHVAELTVSGAIGPATTDYLSRSMAQASEEGARLIVIKLDTPGGLDAATRDIIKLILDSPVPVATYVHPSGGRAASAGTYILYGSHVAAMAPSTTLGAATPVKMGGGGGLPGMGEQQAPEEDGERDSGDEGSAEADAAEPAPQAKGNDEAMRQKVVNDAVAYIRGLAERHGRNADWAERAVREAATLTATEAVEQNVVDLQAESTADLLQKLEGRSVTTTSGEQVLELADLPVQQIEPDWRNEFLSIITNPQVAYILLLIGIYGLIFEGYNPGVMVPGVVGVICLLLGLYALQVLPVNYAGLALMVLGALLMVAEAFVPSFGILGIGGVVALVFGSVMLIDTEVPEMMVSRELIGAIAAASAVIVLALIVYISRNLKRSRPKVENALEGESASVATVDGDLQVRVQGELWRAHCDTELAPGQRVRIVKQDGLNLTVEPQAPS